LGIAGFIPLLFSSMSRPVEGDVMITILDVGQGLAVVVETSTHLLLFDSGPSYGSTNDAGQSVVVPFLRSRDYDVIDTIVISHPDEDHMGGYAYIGQAYPIRQRYFAVKSSIPNSDPSSEMLCNSGENWTWDQVRFEFIYPIAGLAEGLSGNDSACVLKVSTAYHSLLITSDIEALAEKMLVEHQAQKIKSDYLVAPHHGSNTSSTEQFLQKVSPKWVFVSAGYRNRFNHPHPDVLSRYRNFQIPYAITAGSGAIQLQMSSKTQQIEPLFYREQQRKYWYSTF
jgi:competence protein ComEC